VADYRRDHGRLEAAEGTSYRTPWASVADATDPRRHERPSPSGREILQASTSCSPMPAQRRHARRRAPAEVFESGAQDQLTRGVLHVAGCGAASHAAARSFLNGSVIAVPGNPRLCRLRGRQAGVRAMAWGCVELSPRNIRVNVVSPAAPPRRSGAGSRRIRKRVAALESRNLAPIPRGRFGKGWRNRAKRCCSWPPTTRPTSRARKSSVDGRRHRFALRCRRSISAESIRRTEMTMRYGRDSRLRALDCVMGPREDWSPL